MTDVDAALTAIDGWVDEGVVRGAAAAVWHRGEVVASRYAGDAAPGRPVREDTLFPLASVSKPMTALAVVRAMERAGLDLDTPLAVILPEFASLSDPHAADALPQLEALRDRVTVRHALCHTSGLPENVGVARVRMTSLPTLDTIVDAMVDLPLVSAPGAELRYSNAGVALAARAAVRLEGRPFHDLLRDLALVPAGVPGIVARPGPDLDDRIAIADDPANAGSPAESYNSAYWRDLGIPWGGCYASAVDALRFAAAFLPGGAVADATTGEMTQDQTGGVAGGVVSAGVRWERGAWGLGWEVKGPAKPRHWTGTLAGPGTWCHWGQSGTLVWIDPDRDLGLAVFGNRTVAKPWPLRPPRWSDLSDEIARATERMS